MAKINYLEYPATDLIKTKAFFKQVFNWTFTDYGPEYSAFSSDDAGIDGGFYLSELKSQTSTGACLTVFYCEDLEQTQQQIAAAGGVINKPCFEFPGGRRFHFLEPSGSEFAVWSDK